LDVPVQIPWSRALAAALLTVSLSACSDDGGSEAGSPDSEKPTASASAEPSFTSDADLADCGPLLDHPAMLRLAGGTLSGFDSDAVTSQDGAPNGCSAHIDGNRAHGFEVKLVVVPAHEAIALLAPGLEEIDGLSILSKEHQAAVTAALTAVRTGDTDDDRSCEIFSTFATVVQEQESGATYVVRMPEQEPDGAVFGQSCTKGVYAAVMLNSNEAAGTPAGLRRLRAAVAAYSPGELTDFEPPVIDSSACELLSSSTVASLAGPGVPGVPTSLPGSELPACTYGDAELLVAQGSAEIWLHTVPAVLELLTDAGIFADRPAIVRGIEQTLEVLRGRGRISPGEACAVALEIATATGTTITDDTWAGQLPLGDGAPLVQFGRCAGETYSVVGTRRDPASIDREFASLMLAALDEFA